MTAVGGPRGKLAAMAAGAVDGGGQGLRQLIGGSQGSRGRRLQPEEDDDHLDKRTDESLNL